jgi:prepilin-type N-terminal cleavage/methylation domain-containing protein
MSVTYQGTRLRFSAGTRGFTLVEILIAISTFLIVLFAIYSSFEAMELMEGDLRLAGYGFPMGAGNAITAATPTSITFIGDLLNASTIISNIDVNAGDTTINLEDASSIQAGDTIFLINGGEWEQLTVQSINTGLNPHTITTTAGIADTYPWGTQVGRPLTGAYCWYDNPDTDGIPAPAACATLAANTLYRDEPLADNIRSLLFLYFDANDVATANPVDIRRITITLTAQSPPGWWRPQTFRIASDVRPRNL